MKVKSTYFYENSDIRIEVVTTAIADLAMMGFGSIANCEAVRRVLEDRYINVSLRIIKSESDLNNLLESKPDLVVAGVKYFVFTDSPANKCHPEKVWLADVLDQAGILYTGSTGPAVRLDFDKMAAKDLLNQSELPTAPGFTAWPDQFQTDHLPIDYPIFIKPLLESDSKGVDQDSLAHDFDCFTRKVAAIYAEYRQPALVEAYLGGREFTVAILADPLTGDYQLMPVEIIIDDQNKDSILAYQVKKQNRERLIPVPEPSVRQSVSNLAFQAFKALGARDYGRIDIKMDMDGKPFFLEANLLPGMNPDWSYFPLACQINRQMTYAQLVWQMVDLALKRP